MKDDELLHSSLKWDDDGVGVANDEDLSVEDIGDLNIIFIASESGESSVCLKVFRKL